MITTIYEPAILTIEGVMQRAQFKMRWTVSDNFDMTQPGLVYKAQARKTYGNQSVVLEFKEDDDTFYVNAGDKVIGISKEALDMDIEIGTLVFDIRVYTDTDVDAIYLAKGTIEIVPSSTQ